MTIQFVRWQSKIVLSRKLLAILKSVLIKNFILINLFIHLQRINFIHRHWSLFFLGGIFHEKKTKYSTDTMQAKLSESSGVYVNKLL